MTSLLTITDVRRSFGDVTALDGVSLDIREGEFFALLGPSGCGKTTLLRILAGFESPDAGTVTLGGDDLTAIPAHRRPVNLMFQSYALFPHLSIEKNVAYGLEREKAGRAEIRERVGEVLDRVGLAGAAKRRPHQLSGGQRQRVALARAIVKRPRLLLLDEPLSALDRKVRAEMQLWLKQLQHEVGITFAVVTHDQEEAMSMADRIAVLNHGRVEQIDTPVALYGAPRTHFVADFIGGNNFFDGTAVKGGLLAGSLLPGTPSVPDIVATGDAAVLAVRPEQIRIGTGLDDAVLRGTVLDVSFYGGTSRFAVRVPGREKPVQVQRPGAPGFVPDQAVDLGWGEAEAVLIPPAVSAASAAA
ncbi:spermidine/putrescine transport system ATP-binding protein/putrescine transport system ATP-binding protein [Actinoplanes tereljensis]|uniref:Polyamine-transporting ATPase n=1 Tax=Paractinoplanes tereljensis TaxID=571912 RepID=A0A919NMG5_9ACTN|nr:ABC transporter ATP-binding protein [Actinoplanes tereljensis]GIF20522.1 polyamine-transporting ATPase [Actinoplanes tereljensis]